MTLFALERIDARETSRVTVNVEAFRWQWRFDYEGSGVTVTGTRDAPAEMVVPVGEPVRVVLTSADVIHSFYVPAFLFKRDAIPGHPTEFDFTVDAPGGYGGQCAEFCGVYHDRMLLTVRAVTRPEFEAWLASRASASPRRARHLRRALPRPPDRLPHERYDPPRARDPNRSRCRTRKSAASPAG